MPKIPEMNEVTKTEPATIRIHIGVAPFDLSILGYHQKQQQRMLIMDNIP